MPTIDDLLTRVSKPARYTGGEWNSVTKLGCDARCASPSPTRTSTTSACRTWASASSTTSSTGSRTSPASASSRPWDDMEAEMRARRRAALEPRDAPPLREFDVLGFSLQYEMTYTNILNMLDLGGHPALGERAHATSTRSSSPAAAARSTPSRSRRSSMPSCSATARTPSSTSSTSCASGSAPARPRDERLRSLLALPGVYVPRFYEARYDADGHFAALEPSIPEAPRTHHAPHRRGAAAGARERRSCRSCRPSTTAWRSRSSAAARRAAASARPA